MTDIDQARTIIEDVFDEHDCSDGRIGIPEPLMGGFLSQVEFDGIGSLGDTTDGVRISETDMREYRRWHGVLGRLSHKEWNIAFQGEWGTYGDISDAADILRLQVWTGQCDIPADIDYAFGLEHDRLIAQGAVTRMYVASEALRHVSQEALEEVARQGNVPAIVEQAMRLANAK